MSNYLYGRKCRIYVVNKENDAWEVSNLRCTFTIEKSKLPTINDAEVSIYNLTADTELSLIKEGNRLVIEAGYEGIIDTESGQQAETKQYGKVFDGEIVQVLWDREDNVNNKLTLISLDGDSFLNLGFINKTASSEMDQKALINFILTQRTIPTEKTAMKKQTEIGRISSQLSTQKLPRGKVFFGRPRDYLNDIALGNSANFWVDDDKVYITKVTDDVPGEAIVLTPQNGLIGTPQQIQFGMTCRCLINSSIKLDGLVKIDNSLVRQFKLSRGQNSTSLDQDGIYQICKLIHIGDTRGDEWYTEITGISLSGKIPTMLALAIQNPN